MNEVISDKKNIFISYRICHTVAAGAGVAATVGGMSLAVGGTAVGIEGATPAVAAGAVVGEHPLWLFGFFRQTV